MEDLKGIQADLQSAVKLMRDNADEMRKQDERLQSVESLLVEKDEKLQAEIDRLEENLAEAHKKFGRVAGEHANGTDAERDELTQKHADAFRAYIRKGRDEGLAELETKTLSVNSDPDGGYFVTPEVSSRVAMKLFESSPVRQVAFTQTISTDALEGIADNDEATVGWVAEEGSRAATATPTVDKWRIPVHEIYAMPEATQKLLDDANVNVEQWLADKIADKLARTQNTAFVTGNGNGKPRGFTTYANGTSWGQIEQVNSGSSGAPTADGLIDLVYTLKSGYRQGAVFAMRRSVVQAVRKLTDSQNQYLWAPGLQAGQPSSLLGFPIVEMEDMAAAAADSLSIAFGNFNNAYTIVERQGIRTLRDPYTNKPYVRFYSVARVGGDVVNFEAIKLQKFAA